MMQPHPDLFPVPRVLVACEFSGTVRNAFLRRGFDAWSCDLLPDERGSNRHIRDDVRQVLGWGWDLLIVAPLRIARGIQNKVLEAMAMAQPVVISSAPATGLEARSGHDCEIAHSGDEFVSRTVALLADVTLRRTMGHAARETVLRRYSWSAHLAALENLLGEPVR